MPRQSVPSRVVSSWIFVLLTAVIGTVIPLIGFVASPEARDWVSTHGTVVFWAGLGFIVVLLAALEFQRRQVDPDPRDVDLMKRLRDELGADSELIAWIRNEFDPSRFLGERWHRLRVAALTWSDDPARRFRDDVVEKRYRKTLTALVDFMNRTDDDTWNRTKEGQPELVGIPQEWPSSGQEMRDRWATAVAEIGSHRRAFLQAHRDLLTAAHERGL